MVEYKIGNAIVRIHGSVDREKLKAETERYLKKVEAQKKIHRRKANEKND